MGVKLNLGGRRFGRLIVVEEVGRNEFGTYNWMCVCDCGVKKVIRGSSLTAGTTTSCGCNIAVASRQRFTKHGCSIGNKSTPEYLAWENMKARCYKKSTVGFDNHGGRGIKVCDRWINSFDNFILDVGLRPSAKHSLDRFPNNNGDYEPNNVRWATFEQQNKNKRNNRILKYNGVSRLLTEWAAYFNIPYQYFRYHLKSKSFDEVIIFYKNKGLINNE